MHDSCIVAERRKYVSKEKGELAVSRACMDTSSFSSICRQSIGASLFLCMSPTSQRKTFHPASSGKNWICTNFPRFIWTRFFLRFILPDIFNHHQWQPLHSARSLCIFTYILSVSFRCAVSRGFFSGCESESPISRNFNSHSRSYAWSCISVLICSLFFFCISVVCSLFAVMSLAMIGKMSCMHIEDENWRVEGFSDELIYFVWFCSQPIPDGFLGNLWAIVISQALIVK